MNQRPEDDQSPSGLMEEPTETLFSGELLGGFGRFLLRMRRLIVDPLGWFLIGLIVSCIVILVTWGWRVCHASAGVPAGQPAPTLIPVPLEVRGLEITLVFAVLVAAFVAAIRANNLFERAATGGLYLRLLRQLIGSLHHWIPRSSVPEAQVFGTLVAAHRFAFGLRSGESLDTCIKEFRKPQNATIGGLSETLERVFGKDLADANGTHERDLGEIAVAFMQATTVSDFHCVILATPNSSTIQPESWVWWCHYYAKFFRPASQKRHMITRVFSVPATLTPENVFRAILAPPTTPDDFANCQGVLLLVCLIINEICGVDTRLHLFQCRSEQHARSCNDFFETSDYVLMHTANGLAEENGPGHGGGQAEAPAGSMSSVLWVYKGRSPSGDEKVYRFDNQLLLHVFDNEFFRRLTPRVRGLPDGADKVHQFAWSGVRDICNELGVGVKNLEAMILRIEATPNFIPQEVGNRPSNDWNTEILMWLNHARDSLTGG